MTDRLNRMIPYTLLALFCLASIVIRPLLPVDETRYLTVAWEMLERGSFFVPTLNFLPYHHKPPLLFWLVDVSWAIFGVSRAAAMLVVFAVSALCLHLTRRTARALFPGRLEIDARIEWLMLGSVVFLIYSSLILFDLLLTCCVLAAFLSLLAFTRSGRPRHAIVFGLLVGMGILAKGPVVLIHLIWPVILYPFWKEDRPALTTGAYLRGIGLALLAVLVPVAAWLVPALLQTDGEFARALIWEQSAGRISGNMEASHPRPFYFYLMLSPVLLSPWIASPDFWRGVRRTIAPPRTVIERNERRALRLLVLWIVAIVATFSSISGKQPHYIVPALPLAMIALAYLMTDAAIAAIRMTTASLVAAFILGQGVASFVFFPRYDLSPVAAFLKSHPDAPFGFVGFYQGELNFLARRRQALEIVAPEFAATWLEAHPEGYLVDFHDADDHPPGQAVLTTTYREGLASIVVAPPPPQ